MSDENFIFDPSDYARYASIEDVLNNKAYAKKKVRVLGTIVQNDRQSKIIYLAGKNNDVKIECSIPDDFINIIEENQTYQIIGIVESSHIPTINTIIVKPLNSVDQSAYNFAVHKFNEFVFQ
ncbi:hypothetical protein M9Y10_038977 [Tritrichomonas musculus]|uniref:Replication factor A protein 3 n=1 Tax=Tritrichomonas musculus TaxID=1915356 RepID=A0ABR2K9W6_9EUKA